MDFWIGGWLGNHRAPTVREREVEDRRWQMEDGNRNGGERDTAFEWRSFSELRNNPDRSNPIIPQSTLVIVTVSQAVGRLQGLDLEPQKNLILTWRLAITFFDSRFR